MLKVCNLCDTSRYNLTKFILATSNAAAESGVENAYRQEKYFDAEITEKGKDQCDALREQLFGSQAYANIQLVAVSPLRRALQTATRSLEPLMGKVPWIALECLRETTGLHPCDRRQTRTLAQKGFPHVSFDEVLSDDDPLFYTYHNEREPRDDVVNRGRQFFRWLAKRSESEIAVVSHSSYFDHVFALILETDPAHCVRLNNCEMRSFVLLLEKE